ncbi:hypothetical protein GOP47_0022444 [Adiantum capillus-veneris]|uniref:Dol-P-Glc:Glc(2)Man(9)GlcNAc(2)-PP-Dol alpha-1,2-glucosyltransferase n=1 Tax=Adiantum capillus-veneris TaxID=13818 RepID=A0A9D4U6B8_ADICA|nr:hypothetical protein GOP47_0022444 [Adiantum capillus-veneris]
MLIREATSRAETIWIMDRACCCWSAQNTNQDENAAESVKKAGVGFCRAAPGRCIRVHKRSGEGDTGAERGDLTRKPGIDAAYNGRDFSHSTNEAVLQGEFWGLGSDDYNSSRIVPYHLYVLVNSASWRGSFRLMLDLQLLALLSLVAILFRQTNVVWTLFVLCVGILDFLFKPSSGAAKPPLSVDKISDKEAIRENSKHGNSVTLQSRSKTGVKSADVAKGLLEEILYILQQGWQKRSALIGQFLPFTVPIICFLVFVAYNGSIVLGAKEAHKVSPHFSQVLYFSVVAAFALAPIHLNFSFIQENVWKLLKPMQSGLLCYFFATLVGILSLIHYFSFAHPYLVSDNRHYTFYIWRRIINAHWSSKYLLSITYIYSWWLIFRLLERKEKKLWRLVFFGAVAAVLVPTPLIEFRYYTVPLYIIALHTPLRTPKDCLSWVLIFLQYSLVNLVTMYVFLYRPFYSPNEEGTQRFICASITDSRGCTKVYGCLL